MLKVGLTGGMASGKTTVARMLEARGAHVVLADEIAHKLMQPGTSVYHAVVNAFGRDILNEDGTISRPKLAAAAFPYRIKELNALVHPAVVTYQDRWMESIGRTEPKAIVVVEAALIFEAGAHTHFDRMITVTSNLDSKIARVAERQRISKEEARIEVGRRMDAQQSDEQKAASSHFVITNSGTLQELDRQVDTVWAELKKVREQISEGS